MAEIPAVLAEIQSGLGAGNLEHVGERAHYLKNTVFALRIEPMVAPCRAVLERAHAGDVASATKSFQTLQAAFAAWRQQRSEGGASGPASNPAAPEA
jgi:hypothetical protein